MVAIIIILCSNLPLQMNINLLWIKKSNTFVGSGSPASVQKPPFQIKNKWSLPYFSSDCIINILHYKKQRIKQIRYKWSDEGSYKGMLHVEQRNFEDLEFLIPDFPNLELPIFTRDNYSLVRKRIRVTYALLIF